MIRKANQDTVGGSRPRERVCDFPPAAMPQQGTPALNNLNGKSRESRATGKTFWDILSEIRQTLTLKKASFAAIGTFLPCIILWVVVHKVSEPGKEISLLGVVKYVKAELKTENSTSVDPVTRNREQVVGFLPPGQHLYNIAVILNGDTHYAHEVLFGFRSTLEKVLQKTYYRPYFEIATGEAGRDGDNKNYEVFERLLAKFSGKPDLLVAIGTRVSEYAKKYYGDKQQIVFIAVTNPVRSGLVSHLGRDSTRKNIAGVIYGLPAEKTLQFYFNTFPGKRLGYIYNSLYPQDQFYRDDLKAALLSRETSSEVVFIETSEPRLTPEQRAEADVFFGRYYLSQNAREFIRNSPDAVFVGSLMRNVLEEQVLVYGVNDRELGALAAEDIVLKHLEGTAFSEIPILRSKKPVIGVSLKAARKYGITIPSNIVDKADSVIR